MQWLKKRKAFGLAFLLAWIPAMLVFFYESSLSGEEAFGILRRLSDGAFVSGIFFTGFGLLSLIAGAGGFDAFSFLIRNLRAVFTPKKNVFESRSTYLDYRLEREKARAEKGKAKPDLLIVGLIFLALSLIFAVAA
jgi:hypothetical protein